MHRLASSEWKTKLVLKRDYVLFLLRKSHNLIWIKYTSNTHKGQKDYWSTAIEIRKRTEKIILLLQLRKKVIQDEKIEELQRAVSQLQLAAAKREAVEQRLRNKLEEEIRSLKEQNNVSCLTFFIVKQSRIDLLYLLTNFF